MKMTILILMFPFVTNILFGQQKENAEKLVNEGIAYHDKGDYKGAISKYDQALELDKDNLFALSEKSYSLLSLEKYDESIKCCKKAIETHPGDKGLKIIYVTYGNDYDGLKETDKSMEIYDEGIKQFPNYYLLFFNKGITLSSVNRNDEAILCFQRSVILNSKHAGSHNALARVSNNKGLRIPALLAYSRFLVIEPESNRAKENLASLQKIMKGNVEKTGKESITINVSPDQLVDSTVDGKPIENSFNSTDLLLSMDAALDYDKKNKNKSDVEQFIRKFENVCASLKETQKNNSGFFWDYYVPYFIEMKDNNYITTFAYIAFASSEDQDVSNWIKANKSEIDKFYVWSKAFIWKTN